MKCTWENKLIFLDFLFAPFKPSTKAVWKWKSYLLTKLPLRLNIRATHCYVFKKWTARSFVTVKPLKVSTSKSSFSFSSHIILLLSDGSFINKPRRLNDCLLSVSARKKQQNVQKISRKTQLGISVNSSSG